MLLEEYFDLKKCDLELCIYDENRDKIDSFESINDVLPQYLHKRVISVTNDHDIPRKEHICLAINR